MCDALLWDDVRFSIHLLLLKSIYNQIDAERFDESCDTWNSKNLCQMQIYLALTNEQTSKRTNGSQSVNQTVNSQPPSK